eukprot:11546567-Alexandrium_andersonii.AAC.1
MPRVPMASVCGSPHVGAHGAWKTVCIKTPWRKAEKGLRQTMRKMPRNPKSSHACSIQTCG